MNNIRIFAFADEASKEIDKQILAMKRNGLNGLEIRGVDGTSVSDIPLNKAKEVKEKMDAAGLIIWSIGSPIGKIQITDDFAPHLDKFKHTLDIANVLDAKNIRLFSFYIPKEENPADYRNEVMDRMGAFLDAAKGTGINLCHENEKGIYGEKAEGCLDLYQTLPELKGIFDPANFVQCGVDTMKAWELLKNYIHYMHIKDALATGYVVPAGNGAGNVKEIVSQYLALGGNAFTIEPHLKVFDGLAALEREGEETQMAAFKYPSSDVAFDTACNAFKALI